MGESVLPRARGYGNTGFHPDDVNGHMYDKDYYGLLVPDEPTDVVLEEWDYQDHAKLQRKIGPIYNGMSGGNMGKDGYIRVNEFRIKKPDQSQYNDKGTVKKIRPSKTASGYMRKKFGRGR